MDRARGGWQRTCLCVCLHEQVDPGVCRLRRGIGVLAAGQTRTVETKTGAVAGDEEGYNSLHILILCLIAQETV